jgi:ketosteroid isomerase-like protein
MIKLLFLVFLLVAVVVAQQAPKPSGDTASTILAMERAALNRSDRGDVDGFLEISDPDLVYFDPALDKPIYGRENLRAYYRRIVNPGDAGSGVMSNAKVQVVGDVAVLTFTYASTMKRTGKVTLWNTTEVYKRTPAGWRIIHTHWAFLKPELAKAKS